MGDEYATGRSCYRAEVGGGDDDGVFGFILFLLLPYENNTRCGNGRNDGACETNTLPLVSYRLFCC